MNYVNTPTNVLKEFRDGAITTSSGRPFQVWTESGTKSVGTMWYGVTVIYVSPRYV